MKEIEAEKRWVLCPLCGAKTRLQLLPETELKAFPLFARNAGTRASSTPDILSLKNSQTPRRSADRKAGHVLRFASCCFYDACPVGMKTAAPELTQIIILRGISENCQHTRTAGLFTLSATLPVFRYTLERDANRGRPLSYSV